MVVLQSGTKVNFRATEAMVDTAMEAIGFDPERFPDPRDFFTYEEWEEVQKAKGEGFTWIAKDLRGITTAFLSKPVREGAYWNDANGAQPRRLFCDYNCLTEGECTNLLDLFGSGSVTAEADGDE